MYSLLCELCTTKAYYKSVLLPLSKTWSLMCQSRLYSTNLVNIFAHDFSRLEMFIRWSMVYHEKTGNGFSTCRHFAKRDVALSLYGSLAHTDFKKMCEMIEKYEEQQYGIEQSVFADGKYNPAMRLHVKTGGHTGWA